MNLEERNFVDNVRLAENRNSEMALALLSCKYVNKFIFHTP